jgi:hypothetical protein
VTHHLVDHFSGRHLYTSDVVVKMEEGTRMPMNAVSCTDHNYVPAVLHGHTDHLHHFARLFQDVHQYAVVTAFVVQMDMSWSMWFVT